MASQGSITFLCAFYHGPTTKRCCNLQIFLCAQQNTSHLSGKSLQDINSTVRHSSYNCSTKLNWSRAWLQPLAPEFVLFNCLHSLTVGVLIGTVLACSNCPRQCQGMFWWWGFFTIGTVDKITSFWEEDSLHIWLPAVPRAVRAAEGALVWFICWYRYGHRLCAEFCNYSYNYF